MRPGRVLLTFPRELAALPGSIKFISVLIFVYFLGWSIAQPFLPIYFKQLLQTYSAVGIIMGLLYLFGIFWTLFLGSFLDRVSKKALIIFTLVLYLPLSSFLLAMRTFFDFVFFRLYHSGIAASIWTSAESYVRERSPEHKTAEAIGLFDVAHIISMVIGGIISGWLFLRWGFSIFYAISAFAAIALGLSFFMRENRFKMLTKTFPRGSIRDSFGTKFFKKEFRDFFSRPELVKFSTTASFVYFCQSFLVMLLPLFSLELGATPVQIGLIYAAFWLPRIAGAGFGVAADLIGKRIIFVVGLILGALLFTAGFFVSEVLWLFFLSLALAFAFSAVIPPILGKETELMSKSIVGELTAVSRTIRRSGSGIGLVVAGVVADLFGLRYVFLLGAAVFVGMLIFSARLRF